MEISSIITGAALPAAEAAAAFPRSARSVGFRLPGSPEYPLWALPLTDMVTATRRYRHAVPPVRGWLLAARLSPPAERQ